MVPFESSKLELSMERIDLILESFKNLVYYYDHCFYTK